MSAKETLVLTPERAEWRECMGIRIMHVLTCNHEGDAFGDKAVCVTCFMNAQRIGALMEYDRDAAEAGAAEQVTAALAEVERRIERKLGITSRALPIVRDIRRQHADQAEAARRVSEVRQSLAQDGGAAS